MAALPNLLTCFRLLLVPRAAGAALERLFPAFCLLA
jgi:hypothetical protein